MNKYILLLSTTVILFTGCSKYIDISPRNVQTEVERLKPNQKQLIYKTLRDEIKAYRDKGDIAYKDGNYYDALTAYKIVNFYEGSNIIAIDEIEKTAKTRSEFHYKEAMKHIKSDKKRALSELNKVMMNNPNYKNSMKLLQELKTDREVRIFINSLESSLRTIMANNTSTIENITDINAALSNLIEYDYKNPLVQGAKDILNNQYLSKIKIQQQIELDIKNSQEALVNKKCLIASELAKKILKIEPNNKKAKEILQISQDACDTHISELITEGIYNYNNRELNKAKSNFQEVLQLEPNNSTAIIYIKKIDRQLDTIKSLE